MNILMFLIGCILFTIFITSTIWEFKQEKKREQQERLNPKYYYERHRAKRKKEPKRKKGSQSRIKKYKI